MRSFLDVITDLLVNEKNVIVSGQLDELCIGDILCQEASTLDGDESVILAGDHSNRGNDIADTAFIRK